MDKQKQIEEMANDLKKIKFDLKGCFVPQYVGVHEDITARELHDLGYRKIHANAVVLMKEELESMAYVRAMENDLCKKCRERIGEEYEKLRKETAEQVIKWYQSKTVITPKELKEFAAQFGVKVVTE